MSKSPLISTKAEAIDEIQTDPEMIGYGGTVPVTSQLIPYTEEQWDAERLGKLVGQLGGKLTDGKQGNVNQGTAA